MNDLKGYAEVVTGTDLVTGEPLGLWRYAGLIPLIGTRARAVLRGTRHADAVIEVVARYGDDVADAVRAAPNPNGAAEAVADTIAQCVNSFAADTPVATADGETPIRDLQIGDLVLAYDDATGTTGSYTVTATIHHTDQVVVDLTLDGETLETTPEHPFYVLLRGWVNAADLPVGAAVRKADGSYGVVTAVAVEQRTQPMYNLTVATAHTFFVGEGRWLVHNACDADVRELTRNLKAVGWNQPRGTAAHHIVPTEE